MFLIPGKGLEMNPTREELIDMAKKLKKYCKSNKGCFNCVFVQESDKDGEVYCGMECPSVWDVSNLK